MSCIGLLHEHQRPDRELYVHYHCENLNPSCDTMTPGTTCCSSGLPPGCCSSAGNLGIINSPSFDYSGPYDANSIMEYRRDSFALSGKDTLTPVDPRVVVPVRNPSNPDQIDFDRICKMYDTWCMKAQTCREIGCPAGCKFIPDCSSSPLCSSTRPKICCVGPQVNNACRRQKEVCSNSGCDFLLS